MSTETLRQEMTKVTHVNKNVNYPSMRARRVVRLSDLVVTTQVDLTKELKYAREKTIKEATRDAVYGLRHLNPGKYTASVVSVECIPDVDGRETAVSEIVIVEVGVSYE